MSSNPPGSGSQSQQRRSSRQRKPKETFDPSNCPPSSSSPAKVQKTQESTTASSLHQTQNIVPILKGITLVDINTIVPGAGASVPTPSGSSVRPGTSSSGIKSSAPSPVPGGGINIDKKLFKCKCIDESNFPQPFGNFVTCSARDTFQVQFIPCKNPADPTSAAANIKYRAHANSEFKSLCSEHIEKLKRHECCPKCGNFCLENCPLSQKCTNGHRFHLHSPLLPMECLHCDAIHEPPPSKVIEIKRLPDVQKVSKKLVVRVTPCDLKEKFGAQAPESGPSPALGRNENSKTRNKIMVQVKQEKEEKVEIPDVKPPVSELELAHAECSDPKPKLIDDELETQTQFAPVDMDMPQLDQETNKSIVFGMDEVEDNGEASPSLPKLQLQNQDSHIPAPSPATDVVQANLKLSVEADTSTYYKVKAEPIDEQIMKNTEGTIELVSGEVELVETVVENVVSGKVEVELVETVVENVDMVEVENSVSGVAKSRVVPNNATNEDIEMEVISVVTETATKVAELVPESTVAQNSADAEEKEGKKPITMTVDGEDAKAPHIENAVKTGDGVGNEAIDVDAIRNTTIIVPGLPKEGNNDTLENNSPAAVIPSPPTSTENMESQSVDVHVSADPAACEQNTRIVDMNMELEDADIVNDDALEPPGPANTVIEHGEDSGNEISQLEGKGTPTPVTTNGHGEGEAVETISISELEPDTINSSEIPVFVPSPSPNPDTAATTIQHENSETAELEMDIRTTESHPEILETETQKKLINDENITPPPTTIENILESQSHPAVPVPDIDDIDQVQMKNGQNEKLDPIRIQDNVHNKEIPVPNGHGNFGSFMDPAVEIRNQLEMAASAIVPQSQSQPSFLLADSYQSTLLNIRNRIEGTYYSGVIGLMDRARYEYCDGKTKDLSKAPPDQIEDAVLDAYESKQYSLLFAILLDVEGVHNMRLQSKNGKTLLHLAVEDKQLDVVVLLCSMEPDLRILDNEGLTPLLRAIQVDHPEIALYLISFGSDPFEENINGDNAFHFAMKSRSFNTFKQLVTLRPDFVNLTHSRTGLTPVMMALQANLVTEAEYLIRECKADLRVIDRVVGNTSLHFCALGGALGFVDLVIEYGGHYLLSVTNNFGETPLELAMHQLQDRMVVLLGRKNYQYGRLTIVSNDISNGQETKPISCINEFDSTPLPTRDFQYIKELDSDTKAVLSSLRQFVRVIAKPCLCFSRGKRTRKLDPDRLTYDALGRIFTDRVLVVQNGPPVPPNIYECNVKCRCDPKKCTNRSVQNGIQLPLQVFRKDPRLADPKISTKLWGLQCLSRIPKGSFICEFVGEIITTQNPQFRERVPEDVGMHYGVVKSILNNFYCISTRLLGNVSHYINHSVNPNAGLVYVYEENCILDHEPRVGVFASRDIEIEEEITVDWLNQALTFSPSQSQNQATAAEVMSEGGREDSN